MDRELIDKAYLLKNLMDNMSDVIYFKDLESRFVRVNQACALKHGFATPEENIGITDFDLYAKEHAEKALGDEQRIIESGEGVYGLEEREVWADGHITWASSTKSPLRDEFGKIVGTFGITRDITKIKQATLRAHHNAKVIQSIKEEMENDLHMAAELQKTFFPSSYPSFPAGVSPDESCVEFLHQNTLFRDVSSDYCSIVPISEKKVAILLCDVCGSGIRAALGTALVRGIAQEIGLQGYAPGAFLSKMNRLLYPLLHNESIPFDVTACYLELDVRSGEVQLASAGHPVPIHFQHDGNVKWLFENLALQGPALAVERETTYPTIRARIKPGGSLVMFTDGIYTIKNRVNEPFGEKRLISSAHSFSGEPLDEIFNGLEGDALGFSEFGKFADDVCQVGFRLRKLLE